MPVGRRAAAFADVLEGKLNSAAAGASVLSLASLAQRLSDLPSTGDAPTVAATLRADLLTAAAAQAHQGAQFAPAAPAAPSTSAAGNATHVGQAGHLAGAKGGALGAKALSLTLPTWAPIATGALAAAIAVTGVGVGASRSHPGDPFYGAKRVTEHLQATLAGGAQAKALAELGFAQTRVAELTALIGSGLLAGSTSAAALNRVDSLIRDWTNEVLPATAILLREARAGSASVTAALAQFTSVERRKIRALLSLVPGPQRSLLGGVLLYLNTVDLAAASSATAFLLPTVLPVPWSGPTGGGPIPPSATSGPTSRPVPGATSGPSGAPLPHPTQLPTLIPLPGVTLPPVPVLPPPSSVPLPTLPPLLGTK